MIKMPDVEVRTDMLRLLKVTPVVTCAI